MTPAMIARRAAKISINLTALQHNFQQVKKHAAKAKIMPVIKANAYGHGMLQVAKCLSDANGFAVAQIAEAIYLREQGINKPITVFQGFSNTEQLQQIIKYNLRTAIFQTWQIDLLELNQPTTAIDVWLKINTGMGRLGVQLHEVEQSFQRLQKIKNINQIGLMMHFANADEPDHTSNQSQIEIFLSVSKKYKAITSVSSSAAILSNLVVQQDWLRPGIMLYGASPLQNKSAADLKLKSVMSLHAELIAINYFKKGQSVGYGDVWICPENMPVGIVNIGYGDGYPRHAVDAPLVVNNQRCQLIGRVSMDSIAIDLRNIKAQCGDLVECWGERVAVDDVAASAGTIAYELLCNAGALV